MFNSREHFGAHVVTKPRTPSVADLKRRRDAMVEMLDALDDATLAELVRRAGVSARPLEEGAGPEVSDGFGSGGGAGGSCAGSVSKPTENVVVSRAGGRIDERTGRVISLDAWAAERDPVGRALEELFASMAEAHGALVGVDKRRQVIKASMDDERGRRSSLQGECLCCGEPVSGAVNDRLRSGFDDKCRKAWERAGHPDRAAFIRDRRRQLGLDVGTDEDAGQRRNA